MELIFCNLSAIHDTKRKRNNVKPLNFYDNEKDCNYVDDDDRCAERVGAGGVVCDF